MEPRIFRAIRANFGYQGRYYEAGEVITVLPGDPEPPHQFEQIGGPKLEPEEVDAGDVFPKAAGPGRWLMPDGSIVKGKKADAIEALKAFENQGGNE